MLSHEMNTREVLLINFDFPPNDGIGGRRWGKLAKAMAQSGVIVHVIKADPISGMEHSAWSADTAHPNIRIHSIPRTYPLAFSHPKPTIGGKILYRFYKKKLELTTPGTIYDQSIDWNTYMTPACLSILANHKVSAIIATGAPWNLLVYAAGLKSQHPNIPVLVDYRDPWLTAVNYGMMGLSEKRMAAEIEKQKFVFQHSDIVTTPYSYLTEELKKWSVGQGIHQPTFATLPHFFDEGDFRDIRFKREQRDVVKIIYAGDIYASSEKNWQELITRLEQIREAQASEIRAIEIDVYTAASVPPFLAMCPFIRFHKPIGRSVFHKIAESDICLLVLSDRKKDELTTKFYEYLRCRKPLLVVAPAGEVTRYIHENKLGVHAGSLDQELIDLLSGVYEKSKFNTTFHLEALELQTRCEQLLKLLP